jgi:hypothetical protein
MELIDTGSLSETLDRINEAFFYGRKIPAMQAEKASNWIAGRHSMRRSYAGMPAPTDADFENGIKLFTGEKMTTGAGTAHILGEEACRALILLGMDNAKVHDALRASNEGMLERLSHNRRKGTYCCGTCTAALWRHLAVGGFRDAEAELTAGMKDLKRHRQDNGRWRRYPFYYTLYALSEIDLPGAVAEMKFAAPSLERVVRRKPTDEKPAARRRELAERILGRI